MFQSFIVKVWLEETVEEIPCPRWRGHVTHVPSGRRQYIQDVAEIGAFIAPFLEEMGITIREDRRAWRRPRRPIRTRLDRR